ncbi:hypothetical protein SAMN06265795_11755 [Noviherbaspirillum humi]|uniref:SmpA / OmlA family protein n=1 Tax=Noviherbaspirillum humi TaxID=1688639 RepID=A0A239KS11_9BURK|nr:hypothetical protein [Noviherbaspirillum humi]SNT21137.1 hypothetical protein SAMN06265795_11755 [Noviherbaspirillum humi]
MSLPIRCAPLLFVVLLHGCAILNPTPPAMGEPEAQVIGRLGQPTHVYQDGNGKLLEYKTGPFGQRTYMARIGSDGRLASYEQVLTNEKFASIKVGEAGKNDVLHAIGAPSGTSYLSLSDLEVWTYPYKESGVWNSLMHVHFDRNGIVQRMMSGPDPRFDPDRRFPFGLR